MSDGNALIRERLREAAAAMRRAEQAATEASDALKGAATTAEASERYNLARGFWHDVRMVKAHARRLAESAARLRPL